MKRYNPNEIEAAWQQKWDETKAYEVHDDAPGEKFYQLVEFPYPSGAGLHVGHCRPYITFDVMSRWRRMNGQNVLYPIGWDAFGLPAEQYAIKTGVHPAETTRTNIDNFRRQAKSLGLGFDWSREFSTADPNYYKWTQWIFLQLFKHGLAYQAESHIWWCEDLKSVLADEEVINGRSERGDFPCERKSLRQWMLAITKYADRLYDDLDQVDYIEPVKIQQRNWIGRSKGAAITFALEGLGAGEDDKLEVFTTAHDTIFGVTFMVVAPEHPAVAKFASQAENWQDVEEYVARASRKSELARESEKHKTGVPIEGLFAINPLNGAKIPVWIADYVLASYGTGAIMAVPGEDERDFEFAQKYNLPIVYTTEQQEFVNYQDIKTARSKFKLANSGEFDGLDFAVARQKIMDKIVELGAGQEITQFKLRDWVFSRQRYWGEPFPIVWVKNDDAQKMYGDVAEWLPEQAVTKTIDGVEYAAMPVPPAFLPLELPEVEDFQPKGLGQGPLAEAEDWVHVWYNLETGETRPFKDGKPEEQDAAESRWVEGQRETDTMPNWAGSSWYFLRYLDPHNGEAFASPEKIAQWMPVDWYNGGMEHTTLHLLYSRFWHKFLYDLKLVTSPEPYQKRTSHGLVLAEDGRKMSKSWGNVVDPLEVVRDYGADTLRLYVCFMGPFDQTVAWSVNGVAGCRRFIERVWALAQEFLASQGAHDSKLVEQSLPKDDLRLRQILARATKRVSEDLPRLGFNTAVAALMEAVNELYKLKLEVPFSEAAEDWRAALSGIARLLTPFAPHLAEELWNELGQDGLVLAASWPEVDETVLVNDMMTVVVQVNGKLRAQLELPKTASEADVLAAAQADAKVTTALAGKSVKKSVYVPGKLVNFVV